MRLVADVITLTRDTLFRSLPPLCERLAGRVGRSWTNDIALRVGNGPLVTNRAVAVGKPPLNITRSRTRNVCPN